MNVCREITFTSYVTVVYPYRIYRVAHLLANLGWVDLNLGSSPGWWAATVATYCPSRMVEHPKSKSTETSPSGYGPPCTVNVN